MQSERDESNRDRAEQQPSIRLGEQEEERAAVAVNLTGVLVQPALQHEPADQREDHAAGGIAQAAELVDDLNLALGHLLALEVVPERGPVSLDELTDAHGDGHEADAHGYPLS